MKYADKLNNILKSPRLEIILLVSAVVLSYFGLAVLGAVPHNFSEDFMSASSVVRIQFAFFILSVTVSMISVIAGIGGGVIFTPIVLAFTSINSLVVRGTGIIVAMFSGLISTGILIRKKLCNFRLVLLLTISQAVGALVGSSLAVNLSQNAGNQGEGIMRTALGFIITLIAVNFLVKGKRNEVPAVSRVDRFTDLLGLDGWYHDDVGQAKQYRVQRAPLGILLIFIAGVIGGFFGVGGGWAITPVLNMGMGIPLKVAAANSVAILGTANCVSIWTYIDAGAIIPFFVLPWMAGQVIGGFIGSHALSKIRVQTVRLLLIGIIFFTSFSLVAKGLALLGVIIGVSPMIQVVFFLATIVCVIIAVVFSKKKETHRSAKVENREVIITDLSSTHGESAASAGHQLPLSNKVYALTVYWITILSALLALFVPVIILINPSNNVLNPNQILNAILGGASPNEIWGMSSMGAFPGTHYFFRFLFVSDSWAQFCINLGCSVGIWALIPTVIIQLFKEKDRLYPLLGLILAAFIALSMFGVL